MILKLKKQRRYKAEEVLKLTLITGHYVCRCGSTVMVSPKLIGNYEESYLPEGVYDVDDIELHDELKTAEELDQ